VEPRTATARALIYTEREGLTMAQILANLPTGTLVRDNGTTHYGEPIVWQIAAKNHTGYPGNSVTLITHRIIDFKAFDAKEPTNTNTERRTAGNNRYRVSNIHQWLNSDASAGEWWSATHQYDAPPIAANIQDGHNAYKDQKGFLLGLSHGFKSALYHTVIKVAENTFDGGGVHDFDALIYLASHHEVGGESAGSAPPGTEGAKLALFQNAANLSCYPTQSAKDNSTYTGISTTTRSNWWLRSAVYAHYYDAKNIRVSDNKSAGLTSSVGNCGIRPVCNMQSNADVSLTADADGIYDLIFNRPPPAPETITIPAQIHSGQPFDIAWSASIDPDGDDVKYELWRAFDAQLATAEQIYSGDSLQFTDTVPASEDIVVYGVRALDDMGGVSEFTLSDYRTIIHNAPPTISGQDRHLGTFYNRFAYYYSVHDPELDVTTVTERINGDIIRVYTATLDVQQSLLIDGALWASLTNSEEHVVTITAIDSFGGEYTRTLGFFKKAHTISVKYAEPIQSTTRPHRISIIPRGQFPAGAVYTAYATNNANDHFSIWDDCTHSVFSRVAHVFTNNKKTSSHWGINIYVEITAGNKLAYDACTLNGVDIHWE